MAFFSKKNNGSKSSKKVVVTGKRIEGTWVHGVDAEAEEPAFQAQRCHPRDREPPGSYPSLTDRARRRARRPQP